MRKLLTTRDLERLYGGSRRTWESRRLTGDTPLFIKAGRSVFYDPDDVEAWFEERKRSSTSDRGPQLGDA